jgi:hypothetical protein
MIPAFPPAEAAQWYGIRLWSVRPAHDCVWQEQEELKTVATYLAFALTEYETMPMRDYASEAKPGI